jgi:phospholipase/carboxylesterase
MLQYHAACRQVARIRWCGGCLAFYDAPYIENWREFMKLIHTTFQPDGEGPFPAIIAFHGWGANAFDLLGLAPYVGNGGFLMLCPQGPMEVPLGGAVGYGWYPISAGGARPADTDVEASVEAAIAFLDEAVARYPIDQRKLALLGFSQGGVMAYNLALRQPRRCAALVGMSTWFPSELAGKIGDQDALQQLPTLIQHGSSDPAIDVARARESVETLRSLKLPLTYREYDCGHEINAQGLRDLSTFLVEKVISPIIRV